MNIGKGYFMTKRNNKAKKRGAGRAIGRFLLIVLETLLLLVLGLYTVMFVLAHGPSPRAAREFAMTVRQTSALKFLANWYFTDEEIAEMEAGKGAGEYAEIDTSLITLPTDKPVEDPAQGPQADAWGLVDDDGDGIVVERVNGQGFNGYMMVVYDAGRVIMGCRPNYFGRQGFTVEQMVQHYDAVAGVNAGGFYDPNGMGDGSVPDTMVVFNGDIYYAGNGVGGGFAGLDADHILHVGRLNRQDIEAAGIRYGVCFGPVLVVNGEAADVSTLGSGVNPRTAIGQRSDGAILLLVIDGRQATSAGARYQDLVNVMLAYGAVNACNMDGGSSSLMYYNGEYLNNKAFVVGERTIPTTWLVLKEGVSIDG